ncbi:MAG: ABC transporter substrate-binding protein, partial [Candidatus Magnetomorum sp.]|nr:ABC transporter substrate-binding protein [Candidatus Magnetomorum sp.]
MNPANANNHLKTKILIAEDARAVRNLEVSMLKEMGYETILEADDGQKAIDILKIEKGVGLVISDWNMPNATGYDLLVWMRSDDACKEIPFIMATGQGEKKKVMKAKKAGANNLVTKPFSPIDFKLVIESTLGIVKNDQAAVLKRDLKKTASGKTRLKIAHIPITDHVVLGALKHLISTGEFTPKHFELETQRMMLWNPVQVALEKGDVDGVLILAPIAMDLFSFGMPIKLVLLAHKNGSICVRNKDEDIPLAEKDALRDFFCKKTFYLPHLLSVHHLLSTMFLRELGLNPGLSDNPEANAYFEVIPPIKMPDFQAKDKDVGGFMVAEPVGTKAIVTGVGDLMYLSSELWPNHPCCVIVLRDDIIEFDPDAVQEFVNMSVLAGQFVYKHPDIAAQIAVDFLDPDKSIGLKAPVLEKVLKSEDSIITDDLFPNINDLDRIQIYMREKMGMGTLIDMEKFVDTRFAEIACKQAGVIQRPSVIPDPAKALSMILERITSEAIPQQHPIKSQASTAEVMVDIKKLKYLYHARPVNTPCTYLANMYDTPNGCNIAIFDINTFDMEAHHYTGIVRNFITEYSHSTEDGGVILKKLNALLIEKKVNAAVTGIFTRLNLQEMRGEIVSASSPPMILFRKHIPQPVNAKGKPLGIDRNIHFDKKTFTLHSGNRLFFHTHGVIHSVRKCVNLKQKRKFHFNWLDNILLENGKEPFDIMVENTWQNIMKQCQNKPGDDMLFIGFEIP